jgi:coatomer subunit beta'
VREANRVKIFRNFKDHKTFSPPFQMEGIHGGPLVCVRGGEFVSFHSWDDALFIRRIDVAAKNVGGGGVFSDDGRCFGPTAAR